MCVRGLATALTFCPPVTSACACRCCGRAGRPRGRRRRAPGGRRSRVRISRVLKLYDRVHRERTRWRSRLPLSHVSDGVSSRLHTRSSPPPRPARRSHCGFRFVASVSLTARALLSPSPTICGDASLAIGAQTHLSARVTQDDSLCCHPIACCFPMVRQVPGLGRSLRSPSRVRSTQETHGLPRSAELTAHPPPRRLPPPQAWPPNALRCRRAARAPPVTGESSASERKSGARKRYPCTSSRK